MPDKKTLWSTERSLKVMGWTSEYESVQKFLNHLKRKAQSESSRLLFCEVLSAFCKGVGMDPDSLVKLDKGKVESLIHNYLDQRKSSGISLKRIKTERSYLIGFFRENGFKHEKQLDIEVYHVPARYRKRAEYIPTREEVYAMADNAGNLKNRAVILCLFSSGLRNATLRALLYGDVKQDVESEDDTVLVPVYPEMKNRVPKACKNSIPYYTFFSPQATEALRAYLSERKKHGKIEDEEYLFPPDDRRIPYEKRVRTPPSRNMIQYIVKMAARRCGKIERWADVYPHCLRKTFESVLRSPEGGLDVKTQEFLMGHLLPGSQDPYFGSGVQVQGSSVSFDKRLVEEIRAKYAKSPWGVSVKAEDIKKQATLEAIRKFAEVFGIDPMRIRIEKQKELGKELSADEEIEAIQNEIKKSREPRADPQRIVKEEELEKHLADGWHFVSVLPSQKILIKK